MARRQFALETKIIFLFYIFNGEEYRSRRMARRRLPSENYCDQLLFRSSGQEIDMTDPLSSGGISSAAILRQVLSGGISSAAIFLSGISLAASATAYELL